MKSFEYHNKLSFILQCMENKHYSPEQAKRNLDILNKQYSGKTMNYTLLELTDYMNGNNKNNKNNIRKN